MTSFRAGIDIDAAPEAAWAVLTDIDALAATLV